MRFRQTVALLVWVTVVILCVAALAVPHAGDRPSADVAVVDRLLDCALFADAGDACEREELQLHAVGRPSAP
jgi:hypothetical protein